MTDRPARLLQIILTGSLGAILVGGAAFAATGVLRAPRPALEIVPGAHRSSGVSPVRALASVSVAVGSKQRTSVTPHGEHAAMPAKASSTIQRARVQRVARSQVVLRTRRLRVATPLTPAATSCDGDSSDEDSSSDENDDQSCTVAPCQPDSSMAEDGGASSCGDDDQGDDDHGGGDD